MPVRPSVAAIAVTAFTLFLDAGRAHACSCLEMPSPCSPADDIVIFTGRVVRSEAYMGSMTRHRLAVGDVFRGEPGGRAVDVTTQNSTSTCGYPFEPGLDYLVFAWKTDEGLFTGLCTLTGPVAASREYLELLREMRRGTVQSRLRGVVSEAIRRLDGTREGLDFKPVGGVEITAAGEAGRVTTRTDAGGTFMFKGLPRGAYTIAAALPRGFDFQGWPQPFVNLDSCLATKTIVTVRTPLVGFVRGSDGSPLTRPVRVGAVAADSRGDPPARSRSAYVLSDLDGRWRFEGLPPGRYYIGTNLFESPDDTPFQEWWYGTAGAGSAPAVVTVSHDRQTALELRVGPLFERTTLGGIIVDAAGAPVAWANVMLTDLDSGREYLFAAFTEGDGRFAIPVVKGRRYRIGAAPSVNRRGGGAAVSSMQDVGDFAAEIRIAIPGPASR
jgi:hypothetical protein